MVGRKVYLSLTRRWEANLIIRYRINSYTPIFNAWDYHLGFSSKNPSMHSVLKNTKVIDRFLGPVPGAGEIRPHGGSGFMRLRYMYPIKMTRDRRLSNTQGSMGMDAPRSTESRPSGPSKSQGDIYIYMYIYIYMFFLF